MLYINLGIAQWWDQWNHIEAYSVIYGIYGHNIYKSGTACLWGEDVFIFPS